MLLALPTPQSQGMDAPAMRMPAWIGGELEAAVGLAEHRRLGTSVWNIWGGALLHRLPALLPALLFVPMVLAPPLNHDVAAVLQFSQRWLAGEHLYSDLIDVNPPLIFVLNLIPRGLRRLLRWMGSRRCGCVCSLTAGSAGGSRCGCATVAREGPVERAFLDVLPALFLLTPDTILASASI